MRQCTGTKPCFIQEYAIEKLVAWSSTDRQSTRTILKYLLRDSIARELMDGIDKKFIFKLILLEPEWMRGEYTDGLQVEVHKEYRALTEISLIANVGGYLGLFVGFSFNGFIYGVWKLLPKVYRFLLN